jgi:hypothetical protein
MILSRYPWMLQLGSSRPVTLEGLRPDIVEANLRLALCAVEGMRDAALPVGPLLCCLAHGQALIPVPPGTTHWWGAAHSQCHSSRQTCTPGPGQPSQPRCVGFWMIPPGTPFLTDPRPLHDLLGQSRSRMPPSAVCAA